MNLSILKKINNESPPHPLSILPKQFLMFTALTQGEINLFPNLLRKQFTYIKWREIDINQIKKATSKRVLLNQFS